jgi:hypothetical protein
MKLFERLPWAMTVGMLLILRAIACADDVSNISSTSILPCQGVFVSGTLKWHKTEGADVPFSIFINSERVDTDHLRLCKWQYDKDSKTIAFAFDFFWDNEEMNYYFAEPGEYNIRIRALKAENPDASLDEKEVDAKAIDICNKTITVNPIHDKQSKEALSVYKKRKVIYTVVAVRNCGKVPSFREPSEDLQALASDYSETFYGKQAAFCLAVLNYARVRKSPIRSKEDIFKRERRQASLRNKFEPFLGDRSLGCQQIIKAHYYFAVCAAKGGDYEAAKMALTGLTDKYPIRVLPRSRVSLQDVKSLLDELELAATREKGM